MAAATWRSLAAVLESKFSGCNALRKIDSLSRTCQRYFTLLCTLPLPRYWPAYRIVGQYPAGYTLCKAQKHCTPNLLHSHFAEELDILI
eukprot:1835565-Amphidinium_carterae.2